MTSGSRHREQASAPASSRRAPPTTSPPQPAAIADPFPNPDGGDPLSQAPSLAGNAWVGETLAGSVGGWKDPTTDFLRRWVRCDADGAVVHLHPAGRLDGSRDGTDVRGARRTTSATRCACA